MTIDATQEDRRASEAAGSFQDRVAALIAERMPADRAAAMQTFARAYLHRMTAEDCADLEQLLCELRGAFEVVASRAGEPAAVRVITPTRAENGYETGATVVETNTDDLPYLVDSVTAELQARGYAVRRVLHPIIGTERDHDGRLVRVLAPRDAARRESVMHFDLERRLSDDERRDTEAALRRVLADVRRVVGDFPAMAQRVGTMVEYARQGGGAYSFDDVNEAVAFLRWLLDGNFTFLGYREYEAAEGSLKVLPGTGLGLLSDTSESSIAEPRPMESLRPAVQERIRRGDLLLVTKTNRLSPVHRRVRMDYIGVRFVPEPGRVREARLLGLFTPKAYAARPDDTPLLSHKLRRILDTEDIIEGSHDHRAAVAIFSSFPKDELFAAPTEDLRRAVVALLDLQSSQFRLLARRDPDGRSASVIVAIPRDRYTPQRAEGMRRLLAERYETESVEAHLVLGEVGHARVHFSVHAPRGLAEVDTRALGREMAALTRSWDDRVREALARRAGPTRARELVARWSPRFPDFYKLATEPGLASHDVELLERLEETEEDFVIGLQNAEGKSGPRTRLALYKRGGKVALSEFLPILEALGLNVHDERPARLLHGDGDTFVQNFGVRGPEGRPLDLEQVGDRVAEVIAAVRRGDTESDPLNRLVVVAGLNWQQVTVLRAYRSYRQRVGARFSARYEADAFAAHPNLSAKLVRYFELRFDPAAAEGASEAERTAAEQALREEILAELDRVESLDEDRILRDQLALVDATVRTNAFAPGSGALALKLRSAEVPGVPPPAPYVEVFVHSPRVEGIHLRGGPVARGGIRWSDRMDFRTEVFGLMRAQMTKNAVIVPAGAKGGFFLKRRPAGGAELAQEVRRQYEAYIRALLDVTDNIVDGRVVHPAHVRVLDGEDPYLVVAADKGTATFSDLANSIAADYGFWLGDAFASGSSVGYDHKGLGITARGAWESARRLFREIDLDPGREELTAVGIGDMSGDVFGNGMLLSDRIRLVAAYDHRHVFIDPDPDPAVSYEERRRLYELGRRGASSWADYDPAGISAGGGVWPRTAKSVPLSPQARAALGIEAESLTPDEVIRAILRAPVDLLFNGGIGTVVKASTESHADARDRASDAIRVDASELRCRVVAEGGNLGFTQRARIEFAAAGGRINADFIDNSAGVDCSDHEVNLKILLDLAVARGELARADRDELLRAVTDDVVAHVLSNSYRQARILSREVQASPGRLYAYEDLIESLAAEGVLDRRLDALPTGQELAQRRRAGQGLHRPELAVLVALAKRSLTRALLDSPLVDDPWLERELRGYFPPSVVERFAHVLPEHRLRRELVATLVANEVVDALGPSFVSRLSVELGVPPPQVVRAYRIARDVTGAVGRFAALDALDHDVDAALRVDLIEGVERLVEATTRWYLEHAADEPLEPVITAGHDGFGLLEAELEESPSQEVEAEVRRLTERGVPPTVALDQALSPHLAAAPDVIAVARAHDQPVAEVGRAFALAGRELRLAWVEAELEGLPAGQRVQRWALHALRDDARQAHRRLVDRALRDNGGSATEAVSALLDERAGQLDHLAQVIEALSAEGLDLAGLTVVVRELRGLAA